MPQFKTVSNLLALFIFLILYLCIQGCATFVVQRFVAHPESSLSDEFEAPKIGLEGVYSGHEFINGQYYACIQIVPDSNDCKERPNFNLLLPLEKNADTNATVLLKTSIQKESLQIDTFVGLPVKILFYVKPEDKSDKTDTEKSMTLMLSDKKWIGYPSTIIVELKKNRDPLKFAYRIGSNTDDMVLRLRDDNSFKEFYQNFKCKNKENNVAAGILTPFAAVTDIVALPIYILVFTVYWLGGFYTGP